ncbi:toll-like receptor 4 [Lineus longissimus]|uniref:toll-like receptor 4 n=1 Tax=Lineus longissimus TaxID=88925 RepID=UPI002B4EE6B8
MSFILCFHEGYKSQLRNHGTHETAISENSTGIVFAMWLSEPRKCILIAMIVFCHVYMQAHVCTAAERTGNFDAALPVGCKDTTAGKTSSICCTQTSFDKIISAIKMYGENLVSLNIDQCQPQVNRSLTPETFAKNNNLASLRISECKIVNIEPGTFQGLTKLCNLTLTNNEITKIVTGTFRGLHLLLELNLDSAQEKVLTIENGSFSDLRNLKTLSMGQPQGTLVASPYLLHGLTSLENLDLSGFSVTHTEIPIGLNTSVLFKDQETSLQQLILGETDISNEQLPFFKNLKALKQLTLINNHIAYIIKESLPTLQNGGYLGLSDNNIMYIESSALSMYTEVNNITITLAGNPFYCNCDLLGFSRWLRKVNSSGIVLDMDSIICGGPVAGFGQRVVDYDAYWWQCSQYVPLIALLFIIALAMIMAIVALIVYCNWVNIKYWWLERRVSSGEEGSQVNDEQHALLRVDADTQISGKTGAYIIYNMEEQHIMQWANQHLEEMLQNHKMKISLQWPAGPRFIPLWKQIKDHGFDVKHYLVIVTDDFIENQWPEIREKSELKNIRKFVLVLMGKKRSDLPKSLVRLGAPCFEWPETKPFLSTLKRERELFWKRVRIALKGNV